MVVISHDAVWLHAYAASTHLALTTPFIRYMSVPFFCRMPLVHSSKSPKSTGWSLVMETDETDVSCECSPSALRNSARRSAKRRVSV